MNFLPFENSVHMEANQNGDISTKEWTWYENKLFENALAELDHSSPYLFEKIMAKLPWKTLDEIKKHYEQLLVDVAMIENGQVPLPNYGKEMNVADHKRKCVPWTEEEHKLFLIGLDKYGKGDWRNISRYFVPSKTPSQVASHAQKYFRRLKCNTPLERRRYSIHDIRIFNSAIVESPARHPNHHAFIASIPRDPSNIHSSTISTFKSNPYMDQFRYFGEASSSHSNNVLNNTSLVINGNGMGDVQCHSEYHSSPYSTYM